MMDACYKLGVVGVGKMGGALVRALVARQVLRPEEIIAADLSASARESLEKACPGVTTVLLSEDAVRESAVLLIAVKPHDWETALSPAVAARPPGQLVVSVMAGVTLARLADLFGPEAAIVRVMPNIVCELAEGAFGFTANDKVSGGQKAALEFWLGSIGTAEELPEPLLDAVTGLSGSGPAFAAVFIEALADGGVAAGLPRAKAQRLAAQTVLGAARWVLKNGDPAGLKDAVASPGGTTIAGLRELEARGFRSAAMEAVIAAADRSRRLGA